MSGSVIRAKTAVITGAPGAGKTALIEELAARGLRVVPEAARAILREPGGMELRAENPLGFARAMIAREICDLAAVRDDDRWTVFDRGLGDSLGFMRLSGLAVPADLEAQLAEWRYSGPVFVALAWNAIFRNDTERVQDWAEAQASGSAVIKAWSEAGYPLVELPFGMVGERADFVISNLG